MEIKELHAMVIQDEWPDQIIYLFKFQHFA